MSIIFLARKISPLRGLFIVVLLALALAPGPALADSQATQGQAFEQCKANEALVVGVYAYIPCQISDQDPNAYAYGYNRGFGYQYYFFPFATTCASQPTTTYAAEFGAQSTCELGCKFQASGTTTVNGQLMTLLSPTSEVCSLPARAVITQAENNGRSCNDCGNPINAGTGNKFQVETDLAGSGPLEFTRYYNSASTAISQSLGRNWSNTFSRSVYHYTDAGALVLRPDGRITKFLLANGVWTSAAWKHASLQRLVNATGWTTGWRFEEKDGRQVEYYDRLGRLSSIVRADGATLWLTYNYGVTAGNDDDFLLTSVQSQDGRRLQFLYNAARRLTQLTDSAGQVTAYEYDGANRLVSVTYPGAVGRTYHYNEPSNTTGADLPTALTGITDELNVRFATFKYQADGKAVSTEHFGGVDKVSVAYGPTGNTVTFPAGLSQSRTFASPVGVVLPGTTASTAGGTRTYSYDANGYADVVTDPLLTTTDYNFDSIGRPTQVIESANVAATKRTTQIDWHATFDVPTERRILGASGALEAKSTWTYNARGQVLTATQVNGVNASLSRTSSFTYCEQADVTAGSCPMVGLLRSVDGARTDVSDVTTYTYYQADDATCATAPTTCPHRKGDLWKLTNALGQVSEVLQYDGAGRVLATQDANGVVTNLEYSLRGWLTASKLRGADNNSEADDAITRIAYDDAGQVTKVTQPDGVFAEFEYDGAHRLTKVTDALGNFIQYSLDNAGNRYKEETKTTGGAVVTRTLARIFNTLGQLETAADAQSNPTDFTYDSNGNVDTVTDPLARTSDSDFDALGRLKQVIANTGGGTSDKATTQFQYDASDNLRVVLDPKGLTTSYTFDTAGNLTQLTSPDTGITIYGYDLAGNRTGETKADGIAQGYVYDALNRLTGQTFAHPAQNITFAYDVTQADCAAGETFSAGRLTRITDASGSTRYCYDQRGNRVRQVQTVTSGSTLTVGSTYNASGRLIARTYPSGAIVTYFRDANGRVTGVDAKPTPAAAQVSLASAVTYLPFGPLNSLTFGNGRTLTKSYDQNYEIDSVVDSAASNPLSQDLTLDAVGNVTGLTEQTGVSSTVTRSFTYDGLDRLTAQKNGATTVEGFAYNSTGDRLSKTAGGTTNYTYPGTSHRLSAVGSTNRSYLPAGETLSIGSGGSAKNFTYDDNHRLSTFKLNNSLKLTNKYNGRGERVAKISATSGNSRQFVYDEESRLLGEYTTTGARVREYVWMDGDLVAVLGTYGTSTYQYVETDHLGTPRAVINPASNAIIWRWDLNPTAFGEHAPAGNPDGDSLTYELNLRFPGQYYDAESGMNYNYFRDYDPGTGRYIESDPIGQSGGLSTYGYVGANPTRSIDPSGLVYGNGKWEIGDVFFGPTHWLRDQFGASPSLPQGYVNGMVGLGDGASFGATKLVRGDGGVDECSKLYRGGDLVGSLMSPAGRLSYARSVSRLARKVPTTETAAVALSAEREALKRYYRGQFAPLFPAPKTAEWAAERFARLGGQAFAARTGTTNLPLNGLALYGVGNALYDAGCGCQQ